MDINDKKANNTTFTFNNLNKTLSFANNNLSSKSPFKDQREKDLNTAFKNILGEIQLNKFEPKFNFNEKNSDSNNNDSNILIQDDDEIYSKIKNPDPPDFLKNNYRFSDSFKEEKPKKITNQNNINEYISNLVEEDYLKNLKTLNLDIDNNKEECKEKNEVFEKHQKNINDFENLNMIESRFFCDKKGREAFGGKLIHQPFTGRQSGNKIQCNDDLWNSTKNFYFENLVETFNCNKKITDLESKVN